MPREINNKKLKKALIAIDPELSKIKLMKDDGCFYLSSDDDLWSSRISDFFFNDILVCHFNHLSIEEWVSNIIDVLVQDRWDVFKELEPWQIDLKEKTAKMNF